MGCLILIHENSFTQNHTSLTNENIYMMLFMQFEKKFAPTLLPSPLHPGRGEGSNVGTIYSEYFLSSPNINGKEIKLLQASLSS